MSADVERYVQTGVEALCRTWGGHSINPVLARAVLEAVLPQVRANVRREVLAEVASERRAGATYIARGNAHTRGEFVLGLGWSCVEDDTFGCPVVNSPEPSL